MSEAPVYVKLPDLEKTDSKPSCGLEIDQCSYSLISDGCTELVSIGGESATISYALANDGVYIGSVSVPDDVAVSLIIITQSGVQHEVPVPKKIQNAFIPFNRNDPPDVIYFKFYAETPSGPVTVSTQRKSAKWSGYVRTGILEFKVVDSKVVEVSYLEPDNLGRKEIVITDKGDLDVFHFVTENSTDKYYKITDLPASIPWGGTYLDAFPVKISGVGYLDFVVDDRSVRLYHVGSIILGESFPGLKISADTCKKTSIYVPALKKCADVSGCWYVDFSEISLGDAGCLVELSVNDTVVFPSKDSLENPSGTIWENLLAEAVYTEDFSTPKTITAPVKEILDELPQRLQSSLGSYFYAMYPMYGGDKRPLRAVVRAYSGNEPIGMNVYKSGVWSLLSYSSGSQIAPLDDDGHGTITVSSAGGSASLVSSSPLYWLSMSTSLLGSGWSVSDVKVLYTVHSEKGRVHYVFSLEAPQDGSAAEYKIEGMTVAVVSKDGVKLFVGQANTEELGSAVFVPLAVLVDTSFQMSTAGGSVSTTNYTLAYRFMYTVDFVFGFKDAGDGSTFTVIAPPGLEFGFIDKNGTIASTPQRALAYGPIKVTAPLPLTDDLGAVVPNGNEAEWIPLTQDSLGSVSTSVGWTLSVSFGGKLSEYGSKLPAVLRVELSSDYGTVGKTAKGTLADLDSGISLADDIAYMASLSVKSKSVTVSPELVLVGTNHTGYVGIPLSSSSIITTPSLYIDKSSAVVKVQNMTKMPLTATVRVSVPASSGVKSVEYPVDETNNAVTFDTALSDLISMLDSLTSDIELVELVLKDQATGNEIAVDSKYATMLQDSTVVSQTYDASGNPVGILVSWHVGSPPTGTTLAVLTPSLSEEPMLTSTTWKLTSDYVYIALLSKSSNPPAGVLYLYVVKTPKSAESVSIEDMVKVDCSYRAYCKVIVDDSVQSPVLYRLNKDGSAEKLDGLTIYRPGIYVLKGQLSVMGQSVEVSALIAVKGWEVVAVPDQKLLSIGVYAGPSDVASLDVKEAPGYLYIPSKFDEDLLEDVFSCKGNWIEWSGTGDYFCYTVAVGDDVEQNCVIMDKLKAYGPIGAAVVALAILGAMVVSRR